jgi:hypothetical protein
MDTLKVLPKKKEKTKKNAKTTTLVELTGVELASFCCTGGQSRPKPPRWWSLRAIYSVYMLY